MSSQLVWLGRSWYVPVHDVCGHRVVGRRPRAPGRVGRHVGGRRRRCRGRRSAARSWADRRDRQRRRVLRRACALARVAGGLGHGPARPADRGGAVRCRRARAVPLAAGRRGARGVLVGRVPRRGRDRAAGCAPVRRDHRVRGLLARDGRDAFGGAARGVAARRHAHAGVRGRVRVRAGAVGGGVRRRRVGFGAGGSRRTRPPGRSPRRRRGPPVGSVRCRPPRSSSAAGLRGPPRSSSH